MNLIKRFATINNQIKIKKHMLSTGLIDIYNTLLIIQENILN